MNKINANGVINGVLMVLKRRSPEILTGFGIASGVTACIYAVKGTPKALELIKEEQERPIHGPVDEYSDRRLSHWNPCGLTPVELLKTVWRCYLPSVIIGSASILLIIGANTTYAKRNTALAAACTLSETAFKEYQNKVGSIFGEKEQLVRDAIAKDKIEKTPVVNQEVIITSGGGALCFVSLSGRYFKSDINTIKRIENDLNKRMLNDNLITLNDLYYELGIPVTNMGDELGWDINHEGFIEFKFSSQLTEDGSPCLVVDYHTQPTFDAYGC